MLVGIPSLMVARKGTAAATSKLIGADDGTADATTITNGYLVCSNFTANASGTMTEFRIKMKGSGNVQVGIYTHDSGANLPDVLLNEVGSTAVVAGWNTITFPSTSITSGTVYWLAYNSDTFNTVGVIANGTGTDRYKALTFGTAFPNPAGVGFSSATWLNLEAGWG